MQVEANGSETQINWVGGIVKGKAIGVGASVAINKIGRNTRAIVGDFDAALNPLLVPTAPKVNFTINGDVSVKAGNKGSLWAFGVAGAVAISCLLFGLLHWTGGIWYILLTGAVVGGTFAGLFLWRDGVLTPFVAHLTLNLIEFFYAWRGQNSA